MTTSKAHEKVLLSYTHMVFFAVFLFVTLNIRAKFLFLPFKDGGHRCDLCVTDTRKIGAKMLSSPVFFALIGSIQFFVVTQ